MKTFIFFSKSNWNESPRLRHQMVNLLLATGNKVVFFQKPIFFWQSESKQKSITGNGLEVVTTKQFLHHQLRITAPLRFINGLFEKWSIKRKISSQLRKDAVIVNFNYDYVFLRSIFQHNKIVTVINDDFVAQAKFGNGEHVKFALAKTCGFSDAVLTVSYPLMEQLAPWCKPVLFLPWADSPYLPPNPGSLRNAVLVWASINDVIDYELLRSVSKECPTVIFYLVGPVSGFAKTLVPNLCAQSVNIVYFPPSDLDFLPLDKFFAGLMPYKADVPSTEAVTLANKSLRLMSRGLPLIVHGMPHFFKHEAIFPCVDKNQLAAAIKYCATDFFKLQESIKNLVSTNTSEVRYDSFMNVLNKIK